MSQARWNSFITFCHQVTHITQGIIAALGSNSPLTLFTSFFKICEYCYGQYLCLLCKTQRNGKKFLFAICMPSEVTSFRHNFKHLCKSHFGRSSIFLINQIQAIKIASSQNRIVSKAIWEDCLAYPNLIVVHKRSGGPGFETHQQHLFLSQKCNRLCSSHHYK